MRLTPVFAGMLGAGLVALEPASASDYRSPGLAQSNWPIYHANSHATASSPGAGPGDARVASSVPSLTQPGFGRANARRNRPSVSPWTVMAEPYRDGSQAAITTPRDGVAKYLLTGDRFEPVSFLRLDRGRLHFDWGILLLNDGAALVTERKNDRFVLVGDARPGDPRSPLAVRGTIDVPSRRYGELTSHFSLAPDGTLIALTQSGVLVAIDIAARRIIAAHHLPEGAGISWHNSFPIDRTGRLYMTSQNQLIAIDWRSGGFSMAWSAAYDMRGPGCEHVSLERSRWREILAVARGERCTGSGTTPTLLGGPEDGVLVIVEGHAPRNNLVAFWRGEPPADWAALADPNNPGARLDRRVAGVLPLPLSTPEGNGFTAENSPAALGNGIVIAQWAGFSPGPDAPRGLQRVDWDAQTRRLVLRWANPTVHVNGVPTIACANPSMCRVYGQGRYGAHFRYVSVDFETGAVTGMVDLGSNDDVVDQGNGHAVANDGSIVFSGRYRMIRVR
jgi:hypothetical protein